MKSSSSASAAMAPPVTTGPVTVTSVDVLSGRYNYSFNHEGNNFFRDAIQDNREEYQAASRRAIKNQITQSVIKLVQVERGGRFLKLNDKNQWEVMSDDMVYEKVSHALRGSKKKYMQSKKNQKEKNKKNITTGMATGNGNANATATSTTGSASSAASSTGEAAAKGAAATTSYQALASPFVNRAYLDIMARQKVIFEGMVNGSMLQGGDDEMEDDAEPSMDGNNHDSNDDDEYDDDSDGDGDEDDHDDDDDRDSTAPLSRRRESNATADLSSTGGGSAAGVAVAASALVAAMRQHRHPREEG